jgi:hypothetical protein
VWSAVSSAASDDDGWLPSGSAGTVPSAAWADDGSPPSLIESSLRGKSDTVVAALFL